MSAAAEPPVILALTVGGSRQPLEVAISDNHPAQLLLIASDGAGGQASSLDEARRLAAAFKAGPPGRFARIVTIPADNLAVGFARIGAALDGAVRTHPGHRIVANYTGGTKGMSTALLMAAFQRGHQTQLTTGLRADLRQVASGTEVIQNIDTRLIALETELAIALRVAAHGDYAAAEHLIEGLRRRVHDERLEVGRLAGRLDACRDWARCMAAWDRFDHKAAWKILDKAAASDWATRVGADGRAAILAELAKGKDNPSVALCQDLLENARRRYAQGRFDDALARLYRCVEACAQTRLFLRYGLRSGQLAAEDCPADIREGVDSHTDAKSGAEAFNIGLARTMRLLRRRDPSDPLAASFLDAGERGPPWLSARNHSILAHGYRAIGREAVGEAFAWIDDHIVPAMGLAPMATFPSSPL